MQVDNILWTIRGAFDNSISAAITDIIIHRRLDESG
jgi:hypothetical protein